jgi:hypothetical protein
MRDKTQGLTLGMHAAIRSRMRNREVSERRQVGDAESMLNDEPIREELLDQRSEIDDSFYICTSEVSMDSRGPGWTMWK